MSPMDWTPPIPLVRDKNMEELMIMQNRYTGEEGGLFLIQNSGFFFHKARLAGILVVWVEGNCNDGRGGLMA